MRNDGPRHGTCVNMRDMKRLFFLTFLSLFSLLTLARPGAAQGASVLFGDVRIDESKVTGPKPETYHIVLYATNGHVVARQTVTNNGRYRFLDVPNGEYDLVVEVENSEVSRTRFVLNETRRTDVRRDISLEWRATVPGSNQPKTHTVSVADSYTRSAANQARFDDAEQAVKKKDYEQAVSLLRQIVSEDPKDFVAWTELGTVRFKQEKLAEAEKSYSQALSQRPTFAIALLNLGRVRIAQKQFDAAIDVLTRAVEAEPRSADAHLLLGEAYLQSKKGSKAVLHFTEALKLDPVGMADAHLRMAALYHAAGMKDKAAAEYEEFLSKRPDYPEKKKLQQYIEENKKR